MVEPSTFTPPRVVVVAGKRVRTPFRDMPKFVPSGLMPPNAVVVAGITEIVPAEVIGPPAKPSPVLTLVTVPWGMGEWNKILIHMSMDYHISNCRKLK